MKITRERDMSDPIQEWIKARGMIGYTEISFYGSSIDHVGVNWDTRELVLIESKLTLSWQVTRQAAVKQLLGAAFVAVATNPRKSSIARATSAGLGVLRVTTGGCNLIAEHAREHPCQLYGVDRFLAQIGGCKPGGTGGVPNRKGEGPAQDVHAAIQRHLDHAPTTTWKELYTAVPNHYVSYRSLQSSMRVLEEFGKCEPFRRDVSQAILDNANNMVLACEPCNKKRGSDMPELRARERNQ